MTGKTHLLAGAAIGAALSVNAMQTSDFNTAAVQIMACSLGALLPDLDIKNSKIRHIIPFGILGLTVAIWLIFLEGIFRTPIFLLAETYVVLAMFLPHRTITHSIAGLIIVYLVSASFGQAIAFVVMAGYVSHLVLDALTPSGVPLLYPILPAKI